MKIACSFEAKRLEGLGYTMSRYGGLYSGSLSWRHSFAFKLGGDVKGI